MFPTVSETVCVRPCVSDCHIGTMDRTGAENSAFIVFYDFRSLSAILSAEAGPSQTGWRRWKLQRRQV
jgi:hypothetical protein